ncbi:MAG: hypothetical protein ABSE46_16645 [Terracidiphilus sp.]
MTGFVLIMWAVWAAFVLLLIILKMYTDRLARNETDQLTLDEAFDSLKTEQAAIMAKVDRMKPIRRVVLGLTGVMSLVVVGYYVLDVVNQFK